MLYRFVSYLYLYCFCKGSSTHEAACCSTFLFFWPLLVFLQALWASGLCLCVFTLYHFPALQLSPTAHRISTHVKLSVFGSRADSHSQLLTLTFHPFPQATDHPSAVWWQDSARKTTWALQASTCLATSWRPRMAPSTCKARFNLSQKAGRVNLWTWNKRLILHPFR